MRENWIFAYEKTMAQLSFAVTVFATWIVHFLFFLNSKYTASSHLLCMYSLVYFGPARKLHCWFSRVAAHLSYSGLVKSFTVFLYKTKNQEKIGLILANVSSGDATVLSLFSLLVYIYITIEI